MKQETKDLITLKAAETYDWLRAHPSIFWFLFGAAVGKFIL